MFEGVLGWLFGRGVYEGVVGCVVVAYEREQRWVFEGRCI